MGNKSIGSPFPSYDAALALYSQAELNEFRKKYTTLSGGSEVLSLPNFVKRELAPRLFSALNLKRNGSLTFEEYLCGLTVFRSGTQDNKIKCLYIMYDGAKASTGLVKDNLKQILVDASLCMDRSSNIPITLLDAWIADIKLLSQALVETAMIQYAVHPHKIDMQEFLALGKADVSIQGLIAIIGSMVDSE